MSYILDALRKAERERQRARVPTLDTAHGVPTPARQPPWPWGVVGVLALSAVILSLLWPGGRLTPVREASIPATSSKGAAAPPLPAAPDPPAPASVGDPGPPVEASSTRPEPVRGLAPHAPTGRPPAGPESGRSRARVATVVPVAPVAPPAQSLKAARVGNDPPDGSVRVGAAGPRAVPETRSPADAQAHLPVPAPSAESGTIQSGPAGAPAAPSAVPLAPGPSPAAGPGRVARAKAGEALARLTLDVLVYSEVPAERLVFISGRKYVEGQAVDGDAVVEQITPDGAILRHGDQRIVLRPKLNPYARPGSP